MCDLAQIQRSLAGSPEDVRRWFLAQVRDLRPGKQHANYALYARRRVRRIVRYVSDGVAEQLQGAVQNGRTLHELIVEAGERYLCAPRAQRRR